MTETTVLLEPSSAFIPEFIKGIAASQLRSSHSATVNVCNEQTALFAMPDLGAYPFSVFISFVKVRFRSLSQREQGHLSAMSATRTKQQSGAKKIP